MLKLARFQQKKKYLPEINKKTISIVKQIKKQRASIFMLSNYFVAKCVISYAMMRLAVLGLKQQKLGTLENGGQSMAAKLLQPLIQEL